MQEELTGRVIPLARWARRTHVGGRFGTVLRGDPGQDPPGDLCARVASFEEHSFGQEGPGEDRSLEKMDIDGHVAPPDCWAHPPKVWPDLCISQHTP